MSDPDNLLDISQAARFLQVSETGRISPRETQLGERNNVD